MKYRKFILFFATLYFCGNLLGITCLIGKYYLVDIKDIEPKSYMPDIESLLFIPEDSKTPFNEYYPTINSFGSRNSFEISDVENEQLVVLLGDSFFFGYGLNDNETISYFLNKIDSSNRYINLASNGANIKDSVAHYFLKWESIPTPKTIILQILLANDICAASLIEEKVSRIIEKDYKYVLPPFRYIVTKDKLRRYYLSQIYEKIHQDLSHERFTAYVQNPLNELMRTNTKLIIIAYDNEEPFIDYAIKLENYCRKNSIDFYRIEDILENKEWYIRLPDGHPTAELNRALAYRIKRMVKKNTYLTTQSSGR